MHKMHGKGKKWLKYSKRDPKCARKSILGCNGDCVPWKNIRGEMMKSPMIGVRIAASPFGNYDPSCEILRFQGATIKTCAKLYQKNSMGL
jgi:hypothetical protein